MQKKKLIGAGIGIVIVVAGILGYSLIHNDTKTVEVMAETTPPLVEEDSPKATEEPETAETEPQTEDITDTEETAILQEDEKEQDAAEMSEDEGEEEIDAYMYTTADLNMRKKGTTESEVIGSIPYGTEIHVTARTADNWYRTERGEIGYVSGKFLSDTKPQQNTSSQQASSGSSETTTAQPNGDGSSVPGISQADMDAVNAAIAQFGELTPYTGPTSENAWESWMSDGSHHLNN